MRHFSAWGFFVLPLFRLVESLANDGAASPSLQRGGAGAVGSVSSSLTGYYTTLPLPFEGRGERRQVSAALPLFKGNADGSLICCGEDGARPDNGPCKTGINRELSLHQYFHKKGRIASRAEKHRFSGQKAVLFHPQSGAFPKCPPYGHFCELEFFLHSTSPTELF